MQQDAARVAFRAQLVIAEQRQLYDHWATLAGGQGMPARRAIRPHDFPRLLPNVSLISIERAPRRYRYRLAGTRLRDIFDREVTGLYLDEIDLGGNAEYWRSAHDRVADTGRPAQGVVRGSRMVKNHLVQFWLRLPLETEDGAPGLILSHDVCVPVSDLNEGLGSRADGVARHAIG
jgi:hypothetical protein